MRTSLLPGLVEAAKRNVARGLADVALFEVGPVVHRPRRAGTQGPPTSPSAPAPSGSAIGAGWLKHRRAAGLHDAKRAAGQLVPWASRPRVPARRETCCTRRGADIFAAAHAHRAPRQLDPRLSRALGLVGGLYLESRWTASRAPGGRAQRGPPLPLGGAGRLVLD
jgi:phenylalanyl-tRNA synthetase beta chain